MLGTIRRSFKITLASMLAFLYKMYVCHQLEYCVQVWNPFLAKGINLLEKVQRHATKCLHSLSNLSYEERLGRLDLYSLFCRRQRGDLIEVFKILNRYYDIEPTVFFTINNSSTTRGHQFKLFKEHSALLIRQHFFPNRVVNLWNSLPSSIMLAPTVAVS